MRATGPAGSRVFGPRPSTDDDTYPPCPACGDWFVAGDYTTLIVLGPGDDPEYRQRCREGRVYNAVAIEVHAACATGDESQTVT